MKIAYFHQYFGTPSGSSGTRSYEMARAFVEAGHQVTMICASADRSATGMDAPFVRGRRQGTVDGIHVIEFDLGYSNADGVGVRALKFARFALRSVGIALKHDYDVALSTSTPLTAAVPGIVAKLLRRKPFVFEIRDLWPELPRAMGMKNPFLLAAMTLLEKGGYRAADRLVGLAPGIVDGIARTGVPRNRIEMIPNGCDFALFDEIEATHPSSQFGDRIQPDDFVAVFAGAHGRANGLEAVLETGLELKRRERRDIKLLLIGQGSEKPRLIDDARRRGIDNVILADAVPKRQVVALIKGSSVGLQVLANVQAFYNGTSPNKFFDYLSARKPVIINYPGWLADEVRTSGCGIVVPPGRSSSFADALELMADDPTLLEKCGRAARRLGEERYARSNLATHLEAVLMKAAGERTLSPPIRSAK